MHRTAGDIGMENTRVKNGYGLCTSTLSASVIGRFDASSEKRKASSRAWNHLYSADASYQMRQLQGTHPVRKVLHMQKFFPETVIRLNNKGSDNNSSGTCGRTAAPSLAARPVSSRWLRNPSPHNKNTSPPSSSVDSCHGTGDDGPGVSTRRRIADEYQFCHNKMAYNRTKGREAEVDGILTGKSPLEQKLPLFPAKATHQQLLGLVQRPSHPDRPAPTVPRERKWLGNNVGWEGNRGLPTPPAGRNAKDGEVHPWPSSQYPAFTADPSL